MRVYIAARAKNRVEEVKKIQKKLKSMGHTITYDWASANADIRRPYREPANRRHNSSAPAKMLRAAAEADVLILLDEPGLRGAYVELGAFLTDTLKRSNGRQVYIVGMDSHEREHIFESAEFVKFANNLDEVYSALSK